MHISFTNENGNRVLILICIIIDLKILDLGSPRVTSFGVVNGISLCHSVHEFCLNFPQVFIILHLFTNNGGLPAYTLKF